MNPTNWAAIAEELPAECPSKTLRAQTSHILEGVQHLGPLKEPRAEFKRAYAFLTYNEPARVAAVVQELLAAFERTSRTPPAKYNAWNYVVGAHDLWLARARVYYTAAGLVEGALKARLDTRLQDTFGENWPTDPEAVPSAVRKLTDDTSDKERIGQLRRFLNEWDATAPDAGQVAEVALTSILSSEAATTQNGAEFLRNIDFGKLRVFFQARRLWGKGPCLESLFHDSATGQPPLRSQVERAMEDIHAVRNDVAHYRPGPSGNGQTRSFTAGLYALARMAAWMNVDLQHFYGAVDTRRTTELSILIEDPALMAKMAPARRRCDGNPCQVGEPLVLMLHSAPTDGSKLTPGSGKYGCLYHRVKLREEFHRPFGE